MREAWKRFAARPNSLIELLVAVWLMSHALHAAFLAAVLYMEGEGLDEARPYLFYFARWGESIFENYASEGWQVALLAWGLKRLRHVGNPESKDSERETKAQLDRIEAKLDK